MPEPKYYDGTKLLSLKDINGNKPELYLCSGNRSAGKTTYFGRMYVNRWIDKGEKFCLLYRYNYELDNVAEKFFKDIGGLFFQDLYMTAEKRGKGIYAELFIAGGRYGDHPQPCGYAVTLNNADQIKKNSHFFSDVERILFDEFQSETNHYCPDEITKFMSVHNSIARGNGKQARYVPVHMLSNTVSILNPYFVAMGISNRIRDNTHFIRGDGFVFEQTYNQSASEALKQSGFNRAFFNSQYLAYAAESVYLNDNKAFVEKPSGSSKYICTLKYKGSEFAIRTFPEAGIVYCDDHPDITFKNRIAVTTDDHNINYVMLRANDGLIFQMRYYFERGCFRFKDLRCKEAILTALSY